MKKSRPYILSFLFSLAVTVAFGSSEAKITKENVGTMSEADINARVNTLKERVEEIQAIDFSTVERSEKKALKKELKDIKKEMKTAGSYVTISVGAAIIIVLLLILLL